MSRFFLEKHSDDKSSGHMPGGDCKLAASPFLFPPVLGPLCSLFLMVISNNVILFLTYAVIFTSFASIHIPLQQSIITKLSQKNYGSIMGIFNSSKAIGQVTGSLTAGFIFDIGNKLPFLISAILVFISFIVLIPLNSNLISNNK